MQVIEYLAEPEPAPATSPVLRPGGRPDVSTPTGTRSSGRRWIAAALSDRAAWNERLPDPLLPRSLAPPPRGRIRGQEVRIIPILDAVFDASTSATTSPAHRRVRARARRRHTSRGRRLARRPCGASAPRAVLLQRQSIPLSPLASIGRRPEPRGPSPSGRNRGDLLRQGRGGRAQFLRGGTPFSVGLGRAFV